jgi:hypothetical protein
MRMMIGPPMSPTNWTPYGIVRRPTPKKPSVVNVYDDSVEALELGISSITRPGSSDGPPLVGELAKRKKKKKNKKKKRKTEEEEEEEEEKKKTSLLLYNQRTGLAQITHRAHQSVPLPPSPLFTT